MQRFIAKDRFLSHMNEAVIVRNVDGEETFVPRPRGEATDRRHGQLTLTVEPGSELLWAKDVDFVLEGACSDRPYWFDYKLGRDMDHDQYPMGICIRHVDDPEDAPPRSWIHEMLKSERLKGAKHVVVYAECCGVYSNEYVQRIQRLFPDITWTFVRVPDLYDNSWQHPEWIVKAFVREGILRVE